MRISLLAPTAQPEELRAYADLVCDDGYDRLWLGHNMLIDSHQQAAYLAGAGKRIPIGFSIVLASLRHPYQAACEAVSTARLMERDVIVAYGFGSREFQSALLDPAYASGLTAMREYVDIVRSLTSGQISQHDGEYFRANVGLIAAPAPPVRVGVGVLRPKMAAVAASNAEAAVTWLASPSYLRDQLAPVLRPAGNGASPLHVVAVVHVAVESDPARQTQLVMAACSKHLRSAHYRDVLRRSGIVLHDDPSSDARAMVDGGAFCSGSMSALNARLDEFAAAGVDEVVVNPLGVRLVNGHAAAVAQLKRIILECAPSAS